VTSAACRSTSNPSAAVSAGGPGGDEGEDREVTVTSLSGLPPHVAVAPAHDDSTVFLADGSLLEVADHPLHAALLLISVPVILKITAANR